LEAHAGGGGPREGMMTCPVCGEPLPCSSGRAAAEVLFAAGLAESSGLVAAARGGPASPLGLPAEPAAQPQPASYVSPGAGEAAPGWSGLPAAGLPGGVVKSPLSFTELSF